MSTTPAPTSPFANCSAPDSEVTSYVLRWIGHWEKDAKEYVLRADLAHATRMRDAEAAMRIQDALVALNKTRKISDLEDQVEDLRNEVTYVRGECAHLKIENASLQKEADALNRHCSLVQATLRSATTIHAQGIRSREINLAGIKEVLRLERAKTIAERLGAIFGVIDRIEVHSTDTVLGFCGAHRAAQAQGFVLASMECVNSGQGETTCKYVLRNLQGVDLGA